jgi:Tol biopolymer transport system component
MGEVWKARDTRVDRVVAIKFAHARFSERFEREARAIAALNHSNICHLYDVGADFLVMEYVEGVPLKGPLPVSQALQYAGQICAALDAAHRKGIIHRDLKPANILVGRAGVKLLDFGLAKVRSPGLQVDNEPLTQSMTVEGTIIGTLPYMSPEQLQGKEADERSDVFSFGLVLYEVLTGARAFRSESATGLVAEILKGQPPPISLQHDGIPPALERTIATCLEKDPEDRWQSARELKHALAWIESAPVAAGVKNVHPRRRMHWPLLAGTMIPALLTGAIVGVCFAPEERGLDEHLQFTPLAADAGAERQPKLSPDGRSIAYVRPIRAVPQLFVRSLTSGVAAQLTNSMLPVALDFWSGDSRRIYFRYAHPDTALWSISASGGTPQRVLPDNVWTPMAISPDGNTLALLGFPDEDPSKYELLASSPPGAKPKKLAEATIPPNTVFREMTFSPDGSKLIVPNEGGASWFMQYPSGNVVPIPWLKEMHTMEWLPDSRHVVVADTNSRKLMVVDTETAASHVLLSGPNSVMEPTVSRDGSRIAYTTGVSDSDLEELSIEGRKLRSLVESALSESAPEWSPKGDRFAYVLASSGVWLRNADGTGAVMLVNDPNAYSPAFAPDNRRLAFRVGDSINTVLLTGGEPVRLKERGNQPLSFHGGGVCWSPDGDRLAYTLGFSQGTLWTLRASGEGQPEQIADDVRNDSGASCAWLLDGRWIAYPGQDGIHVVSTDGKQNRTIIKGSSLIDRFNPRGELVSVLWDEQTATQNLVTYDVLSGRRISSAPLDVAPGARVAHLSLHPDGRRVAVEVQQEEYDIWMMEGFPRPTTGWMRLLRHWTLPSEEQSSR